MEKGWEINNPFLRFYLSFMIAGGTIFCSASATIAIWITVNAVGDHSKPKHVPVVITRLVEDTSSYILHDNTIKFRFMGDKREQSILSSPTHMKKFNKKQAIAIVHKGRFDWPWVSQIYPEKIKAIRESYPPSHPGQSAK